MVFPFSHLLTICWYEEDISESNETFDGSVIEDQNDLLMFSDRIITKKVFNVAEEDNSDPLFDTMKAESKVEVFLEVKEDQDENNIKEEVVDNVKHSSWSESNTCPDCYKEVKKKKKRTLKWSTITSRLSDVKYVWNYFHLVLI